LPVDQINHKLQGVYIVSRKTPSIIRLMVLSSLLGGALSVQAEVRPEVVERIKPIGSVVLDEPEPAPTPAAAPAPAEPEVASESAPQATGEAPASEEPAAEAPAVSEAPATAAAGGIDAEAIYNRSCIACHMSGAANAPKLGDKAAWEPRIAKGMDALYQSSINGIPGTAMQPKGTCATCSEEELHAVVDFMVSKVQ
jgi:cytochrome c5